MKLIDELAERYRDHASPFLIAPDRPLSIADLQATQSADLSTIKAGDVVAVVGDFDAVSISTLLHLLDRAATVVPLTTTTRADHPYYFDASGVNAVVEGNAVELLPRRAAHPLVAQLRETGSAGLVLFSSGTTGRPKAILHDFSRFLARYRTPRPALSTVSFLLFDHIGGINTLFHTLFNRGLVVVPPERTVQGVIETIARHRIQCLPTTPTFLRMVLLSGALEGVDVSSLSLVTYGTERMDQPTLDALCRALPHVDFRQTYGMSELGILRVKSRARDSLWMRVGGEGVELRVVDGVLHIRTTNHMLGYLNAPSPFVDGWYDTGDVVEEDSGDIRVVGRTNEVINVGGAKVLPSEIERVALLLPQIARAKAVGARNPITGQHIEVTCEPDALAVVTREQLREHFRAHLPEHSRPHRIRIGGVPVSHRFKRE